MKSESIRRNKTKITENYKIDSEDHIEDYDTIEKVKEHTIHKHPNYVIRFLRKRGQYEINIYILHRFSRNKIDKDLIKLNQDITSIPNHMQKKFKNSVNRVKSYYNLSEKNDEYHLKRYDNNIVQYTKILE